MSTTESVARCIVRLEELSDFLRGQMDGVPETHPYGLQLTRHARTADMAAQILAALEEHSSSVERSVKKLVSQ
jgi:hypothetical protein